MKKSTAIPALLLIYLAVMSAIGYNRLASGELSLPYYLGVIAVTLAVIRLVRHNILLREQKQVAAVDPHGKQTSSSSAS